jgi:carbamoyl-phosphate synthase small subunit
MAVEIDEQRALAAARAFPGLAGMDLARVVSVSEPYAWVGGAWGLGGYREPPPAELHVVAYDYGVKHNILRMLAARGCRVTVVPAQTTAAEVLERQPDGVFLSNGPGDPEPCEYAINAIREILARRVPTFGICLGHQLLALASGARTMKMKFGHHGANHPVKDLQTGQVLITSQNHGFAVDADTLPTNLMRTHVFALRRLTAGRCAFGRAGVFLPGTSRGESGAARHRLSVRPLCRDDATREEARCPSAQTSRAS